MAEVVLGLGTSHSPLLTLDPADWQQRADDDYRNPRLNLSDGRFVSYRSLSEEVSDRYGALAVPAEFARKAQLCQAALERLADALQAAHPDVVIIVGDDQG